MNNDTIRMAREAGLEKYHLPDSMMEYEFDRCIERFAALVRADEREACAEILDRNADACASNSMLQDVLRGNALAIRARGSHGQA